MNSVMHKITIGRTFNIGNYESIKLEASAEHEDANTARLLASRTVIELVQMELIRIYNVRNNNLNYDPWIQTTMELAGLNTELGEK